MNHIGDTNKMVSGNPRMDASAHDDGAIWETGCDIERELNAANDRIKRLEDSYEAKDQQLSNLLHICRDNDIEVSSYDLIHGRKAK